jgi:hypothetical protein
MARLHLLEGFNERTRLDGKVKIIDRLGDIEIRIRIKPIDEGIALVAEIALYFEVNVKFK